MSNIIHIPQNRVFKTEILIKNGEEYYQLGTGEKLVFGIKVNPYSSEYVLKKEVGATGLASDKMGYLLTLSTKETNLPQGKYYYDIALKKMSGELEMIIGCTEFVITNSIVRSE